MKNQLLLRMFERIRDWVGYFCRFLRPRKRYHKEEIFADISVFFEDDGDDYQDERPYSVVPLEGGV